VHGSDSPESAEKEIGLFFDASEIAEYGRTLDNWLISEDD
jgi:nucleoside-diphosphate kinase